MAVHMHDTDLGVDTRCVMPLVVGAHLRAEQADRPLAYRLRERILAWQHDRDPTSRLAPIVCSDVWFLNAGDLMSRPTIALGRPGVNAGAAYLANRLPVAFVVEDAYEIQLDPEFVDLQVCIWGVDPPATAAALDQFEQRYLPDFLEAAHCAIPDEF